MAIRLFIALIVCIRFAACASVRDTSVLVEAESMPHLGGWMIDPQFMDQMGSPYLLAHGLGKPVADASTTVQFPKSGTYHVFVRTKDWVAQWKAPGTPGRFQLLIYGKPLKTTFGIEGAEWHWQPGGTVKVGSDRKLDIALHDLTGFEGRCDAILFTTEKKLTLPNQGEAMADFRRELLGFPKEPEVAGTYDFVVVGGGMSGTCASIAAARLGLKVALIQDRPVLGGNNSSEVRVWLQGARTKEPWPRIGDIVAELEHTNRAHYGPSNTAQLYEDEKKMRVASGESNLTIYIGHRANQVITNNSTIKAIIAEDTRTSRRIRINGRWFADCTGDAVIGALAGADFELQAEGRMGQCNLWNVCECKDTNAINVAAIEDNTPKPFPRCPWALDLSKSPFPGRSKTKPNINQLGGWYWESGFDRNPITEMEYIRDWNFRAMYGAWDAMKNVDHVLPNHSLNWAAYIIGKRESRRLLGDLILTVDDLKYGKKYPDGCVPSGWKIDVHVPNAKFDKGFEGDAFISKAEYGLYPMPYWVPYRCLYSRNITNLFMAGRDISVTHEALGAVRVMRTCGCMGEVIGMAACICKKHEASPRDIYATYLTELQDIMRKGAGKKPADPHYENQGEPELAAQKPKKPTAH
ncbi:MAG: FAD-dependent oxidoreductase [Limisphaerales bacterium]